MRELSRRRISTPRLLIVQYSGSRDGSTISALMLADGLRRAGWETHVAFASDGTMTDVFRQAGHYVRVIPHKNWLRSKRYRHTIRNVAREVQATSAFAELMRELRPNLVYINTGVSLSGAIAAYKLGIPSVWHLRELFADVGGELQVPPGFMAPARWAFRTLATRLVVNSEAAAANVLQRSAGSIDVVPNAVSPFFFDDRRSQVSARKALELPDGVPIVGIPGTLRPTKGHPFFFQAIAPVVQQYPELTIVVTGDGEHAYKVELEALVRTLGMGEQVRFIGSISDMPGFYRACDFVCVPSRSESFGRTVIEAFASGVPVLATAVGGILEIVTQGETGLLVPYGDEVRLAAAVMRLLGDAHLRERLGRRARAEAELRYHEVTYQMRLNQIAAEVAGLTPELPPGT